MSFDPGRKPDPTSPTHYARFKIQPIEFITANNLGFLEGNVIKYVCRYDAKNGLEDLKKARNYLDKMIAREEQKARAVEPEPRVILRGYYPAPSLRPSYPWLF